MKVVVIGRFPEDSRRRIAACFPEDWSVCVTAPEEAGGSLRDAAAVIPEHAVVDARFLDQAPKLAMVQTGAGFDNVDIPACTRRGVRVCNAAGVNAAAVAEHVMALMLGWYKNIPKLDQLMKTRREGRELCYTGAELSGRTAGIIGLGSIGRRVAELCGAFGMRVLGTSRRRQTVPGVVWTDLERICRESEVITVHVPLNDQTHHLLDRSAFEIMRRDALLINTSRGAVIHEAHLIEALERRAIAGACLDVYEQEPLAEDSPLRDFPNVILTPHTAGFPDGVNFHAGRYRFFAENIQRLLDGRVPENALNDVPVLRMPRRAPGDV